MNIKGKLISGLCVMLLAGAAQASLMVHSIDLAMVKTDFNSRSDVPALMGDKRAFLRSLFQGFLPAYNHPDTLLCELSLEVFENISASETCNGPNRDIGTLFAVTGSSIGVTHLQLGLDWGLGGFTVLALDDLAPQVERYNTDIWWHRNWDHRDVLDLLIPESDNFLLVGLGFEHCCDGVNSARWRSLGNLTRGLGAEGPGEWQTLAVNDVPEPGVFSLFALGLLGVVATRRVR